MNLQELRVNAGEETTTGNRLRHFAAMSSLVATLTLLAPRRGVAEDFADAKVMYYQEEGNRMKILAPSFMVQRQTEDGWTVRIDGIYNSISGATPTGAPPPKSRVVTTRTGGSSSGGSGGGDDGGGDDDHGEADSFISSSARAAQSTKSFAAATGATPPPSPSPSGSGSSSTSTTTASPSSGIPTAHVSDQRVGLNLLVSKRIGDHTPALGLSFSTEQDYRSTGISLLDAIEFNKKNTTLTFGGAYTSDTITPSNDQPGGDKKTTDALVGLTQVLSPTTLFSLNLCVGRTEGYLSDPYKVVELNGVLVPEQRPDSKTKTIAYMSLTQFVTPVDGSIELSFRHYSDSFGINAETFSAEWHQKMSPGFILVPSIRYYDQTAADFYDVRFSGSPSDYSSDYRLSALQSLGYGLKVIWTPSTRFSLDAGYERYEQKGKDTVTSKEVYPSANVFIVGVRVWL